ncbi:MAG: porin family protein [Mesorhizobium sp.]|nr:outer membrane beta-barrel protein [Mesorhizobium sp.]MBL8580029.1 porin family protein [Mesorhizobium sp.]
MKMPLRFLLSIAVLSPVAASAADYDPPLVVEEAAEYVPVEVGSGWYLRGDVGYSFSHPFQEEVWSVGGEQVSSSDNAFTGSIGMGYNFTDYFRGDLNFSILPSNDMSNSEMVADACAGSTLVFDGTNLNPAPALADCRVSNYGENKGYALMANAYVDLGTYVGITPYVGGGLGVAYNKYYKSTGGRDCVAVAPDGPNGEGGFFCTDPDGYGGAIQSESQYNLAYSLAAGLSYQMTKNVSVDLGYEYTSVPDALYVAYDDGAFGIQRGIDYQTVKLGFRYDLW